jgi:lipopolysaccharide heptosyltransferase II
LSPNAVTKTAQARQMLAMRNSAMAEAFHQTPFKHRVRRSMLRAVAQVPFTPIPQPRGGVERILLIRPDHLGDVLLSTPAIHALREARPNAEIYMLAGPWSGGLLANYPEFDRVLTIAFPGFSRSPKVSLRSPYEQAVTTSRLLRRIGFTSAVILRPDHWWGAMLAHLAGIPRIIGYDLSDVNLFLTEKIPFRADHAILQNLRLVESWTGAVAQKDIRYEFRFDTTDQAYIDGYLSEWGLKADTPWICIHPGSGTQVKQWNMEKWASVADTLSEQLEAKIILTGGDKEMPLVQQIAAGMTQSPIIMAGDTQVGQLGALFARAKVVLGSDSGPLHLAAAVGTPTVALYGPANPAEFGTWGTPNKHIILTSDIACRPCGILDWSGDDPENHPCVTEITIGRVLEAARLAANYNA